ncbi:hypothetical protein AQUCO_01300895v1 [Aquilegia coerulea]|uniref:FYVE-type domain-containing protein n=1 Tax=Aquilegia coerulea TaxID=218851 RepID=A0A2G5E442_AQUCA|nr:hypothetical protein AQUCO_01300895v1 [Aquilegia coerulea]
MSSIEPPPFQESARCNVCSCSFNAFRRRHHCRCCGRTLCHDHSSNQMALPQFGIYTSVRVCADCFNNSRSGSDDPQLTSNGVPAATEAFSRVSINENINVQAESSTPQQQSIINVPECKCGMPLCICESSAPSPSPPPAPSLVQQVQNASASQSQSNLRQKKIDQPPKHTSSASNSKPSSFFSHGQLSNGSWNTSRTDYEVNGEGLKEAIKNSDTAAVQKLLSEGVDANYCDKQGFSLLHLAAVFNQTEITFILMDHGASLDCKNQQGETPLDCAPPMLQHKMKSKIEGGK